MMQFDHPCLHRDNAHAHACARTSAPNTHIITYAHIRTYANAGLRCKSLRVHELVRPLPRRPHGGVVAAATQSCEGRQCRAGGRSSSAGSSSVPIACIAPMSSYVPGICGATTRPSRTCGSGSVRRKSKRGARCRINGSWGGGTCRPSWPNQTTARQRDALLLVHTEGKGVDDAEARLQVRTKPSLPQRGSPRVSEATARALVRI